MGTLGDRTRMKIILHSIFTRINLKQGQRPFFLADKKICERENHAQ